MEGYRIKPQEAALLIIDMQRGFLDQGSVMEVPGGRAIVPNVRRLIDTCYAARMPVIFTWYVWSPKVPNLIGELHSQHKPPACCCMEGHESVEMVPELAPSQGDLVLKKHGYDAFFQTRLDYALRSSRKDQLVVTGVMTDVCVLATVSSALHREYRVTVVSDGVAASSQEAQKVTLDLISRSFGRVATTEDLVREILEGPRE